MPSPSNFSQSAMRASGSADNSASTNDATIIPGSWRYPSTHSRHIDESAGGNRSARSRSMASGEDVIGLAFLVFRCAESLRLQVEHRSILAAAGHQLVMCAELCDASAFNHTDAVGVAHRRESVRNQDGGALPGGGENPIEN